VIRPRLILCNGALAQDLDSETKSWQVLKLCTEGADANVNLRIEDLKKATVGKIPDRIFDLLEIAAFVFTTDCAVSRGQGWTQSNSVEAWDRQFHLAIAVRDLVFWDNQNVKDLLKKLLGFIADDRFAFSFEQKVSSDSGQQDYLEFTESENTLPLGIERVTMFSGGLDSLAGTLETLKNGENAILVSHRSTPVIDKRQKELYKELKNRFSGSIIHVPVQVNKDSGLDAESTQRTRSFLFGCLGAAVAELFHVSAIRFYENGVVSLNLPVADEVLRARASRTTHPLGLQQLSKFLSLVLDRPFEVDNPYLFKTKLEVVQQIEACGQSDLIGMTCSCATPGRYASAQHHCGSCSQCIDRRIAILAASLEDYDGANDYKTDVITGARDQGYEHNIAVNYARHAIELFQMSESEMGRKFGNDFTRAARNFPQRRDVVEDFIKMHKRHAATVHSVLEAQIIKHGSAMLCGSLEPTSMLSALLSREHLQSSWTSLATRIADLLEVGVQIACQTHLPEDEPHLQEICDAILVNEKPKLTREFPFLPWSLATTKPDWSQEDLKLWIELKYVRKKYGVSKIVKDVAEDITKYGDNGRRVLFVVYDPDHVVKKDQEAQLNDPIHRRPDMMLKIIR
jgi:7-cyano-7-deazaguanine synthase in queuosine biosynthesis